MKFLQYGIFSIIILLTTIGLVAFVMESSAAKEARRFDSNKFMTSVEYTKDELSLFCDIAFTDEEVCVRKWKKDIKVEIINIAELDKYSIAEVDSVIAILAPLIEPIKIKRVEKDGNLHVHRKVQQVTPSKPEKNCLNGLARINKKTPYSWEISYACIYDGCEASSQTLMHEFQHALGLSHPIKLYSYYLTIGRSVIPQYFRSKEEIQNFLDQPFYLSEQEKTVIKMLYSPEIPAGLHINLFADRMGFNKEDRKQMIPDINKKPRIVVYPSYELKLDTK